MAVRVSAHGMNAIASVSSFDNEGQIPLRDGDRCSRNVSPVSLDDLELAQGDGRNSNESMKNQAGSHRHQLFGVAGKHQTNIGSQQLAQAIHRDDVDHAGLVHDHDEWA